MAPHPPGFFPAPLIIPPLTLPHKQTFILLHGRGSTPSTFKDILSTPFPSSPSPSNNRLSPSQSQTNTTTTTTLRETFPHAKFIFPHAPRQRATIYKRSIIPQWFDSWHLTPTPTPSDSHSHSHSHSHSQQQQPEEWRTVSGLLATLSHIHELIRTESALLSPSGSTLNIVLGGLSQGCAASLMALLLWDGPPLAGYLGMCGWLPFAGAVRGVVGEVEKEEEEEFDPFERDEGEGDGEEEGVADTAAGVVRALREVLEVKDGEAPVSRPRAFDTPIFLGHGDEDDKVPIACGREAAECVEAAGFDASWKECQGLGHWYSAEMLADMTEFLKKHSDWEGGDKAS